MVLRVVLEGREPAGDLFRARLRLAERERLVDLDLCNGDAGVVDGAKEERHLVRALRSRAHTHVVLLGAVRLVAVVPDPRRVPGVRLGEGAGIQLRDGLSGAPLGIRRGARRRCRLLAACRDRENDVGGFVAAVGGDRLGGVDHEAVSKGVEVGLAARPSVRAAVPPVLFLGVVDVEDVPLREGPAQWVELRPARLADGVLVVEVILRPCGLLRDAHVVDVAVVVGPGSVELGLGVRHDALEARPEGRVLPVGDASVLCVAKPHADGRLVGRGRAAAEARGASATGVGDGDDDRCVLPGAAVILLAAIHRARVLQV